MRRQTRTTETNVRQTAAGQALPLTRTAFLVSAYSGKAKTVMVQFADPNTGSRGTVVRARVQPGLGLPQLAAGAPVSIVIRHGHAEVLGVSSSAQTVGSDGLPVPPEGVAGGDLSGTYPNPSVDTIHSGSSHASAQAAAEATAAAGLAAHTGDASDAHAASAVSFTPTGTIAATDAQAAVAEVATDAATALATHAALIGVTAGDLSHWTRLANDAHAVADAPSTYPVGISYMLTVSGTVGGWPNNQGSLLTTKGTTDVRVFQTWVGAGSSTPKWRAWTGSAWTAWNSVDVAVAAHEALSDPHTGYATDTDLTTHAAAGDPHTGYRLESADHNHATTGLQGGTVAHSVLTGLTTGDPHTQYQQESEKSAASGYASLDGSTKVPIAELPTGTSGTTVALGNAAAGLITTHEAAGDPHAGYRLESAQLATADYADDSVTFPKMANLATDRLIGRDTAATGDPEALTVGGGVEFTGSGGIQRSALTGEATASAGSNAVTVASSHGGGTHAATQAAAEATAASALSTHAGAADPHTGYRLESADHTHQSTGLQGGTLDHGAALTGLGDDDHPQYQKVSLYDAKGDLIGASANDTPVKITVGADGTLLMADAASTAGVKWATPTQVKTALSLTPGTDVQAWDTDLDAIAALGVTNDSIIQGKAGVWSKRTMAQLIADLAALGTTFQPLHALLTALAGVSGAADKLPYLSGATAFSLADLSSFARTFLDDTTAAAVLNTLGIGTASGGVARVAWPSSPIFSCATPGTMSMAYTVQTAHYIKTGTKVEITGIVSGTLTSGTGSGNVYIGNLPFTIDDSYASSMVIGGVASGWTKAGYTRDHPRMNSTIPGITWALTGSGVALAAMTLADLPTGTAITFRFQGFYYTTA